MTTLNTIIEEGKDKIFCKYDFEYMNGTTVGVIEDLNNDLDTAMQRAYEAGRTDWLRSEIGRVEMEIEKNTFPIEIGSTHSDAYLQKHEDGKIYNRALTSIITRYKEELKVLESK